MDPVEFDPTGHTLSDPGGSYLSEKTIIPRIPIRFLAIGESCSKRCLIVFDNESLLISWEGGSLTGEYEFVYNYSGDFVDSSKFWVKF